MRLRCICVAFAPASVFVVCSSEIYIRIRIYKVNVAYLYGSCFSRRDHRKSHDNATNTAEDAYEEPTQMTKSSVYEMSRMTSDGKESKLCPSISTCLYQYVYSS